MKMTEFYCKAGQLVKTYVRQEGQSPRRSFIAHFDYERGTAEFEGNGREGKWTFVIHEEALA